MNIIAYSISIFSIAVFAAALFCLLYYTLIDLGLWKPKALSEVPSVSSAAVPLPNTSEFPQQQETSNRKVLLSAAILTLTTRFGIYLLGYIGGRLFLNESGGFLQTFMSTWFRWDADNYIYIAQNWYTTVGDKRLAIVFFPFYSLVIRVAAIFIQDYFLSGILVSNLSLVVACFYLYKLAEENFSPEVGFNSVKYLLLFPVSFFLGATFSESTFLALSIMTLYYSGKGKWLIAGILGALAALTRSLGVLLAVPVFLEFLITAEVFQSIRNRQYAKVAQDFLHKGFSAFLIPVGTLLYLYINKAVTGNWFTFLTYQKEHWHQSFGVFFVNMKSYVVNAATWDPAESASLWTPQLIIILCAMLLLLYGFGRIKTSHMAYFFISLFISISPTWLLSGPRYIMGIFPVYFALALLSRNKYVDFLLTSLSAISLCYCTLAFVTGHYIM